MPPLDHGQLSQLDRIFPRRGAGPNNRCVVWACAQGIPSPSVKWLSRHKSQSADWHLFHGPLDSGPAPLLSKIVEIEILTRQISDNGRHPPFTSLEGPWGSGGRSAPGKPTVHHHPADRQAGIYWTCAGSGVNEVHFPGAGHGRDIPATGRVKGLRVEIFPCVAPAARKNTTRPLTLPQDCGHQRQAPPAYGRARGGTPRLLGGGSIPPPNRYRVKCSHSKK